MDGGLEVRMRLREGKGGRSKGRRRFNAGANIAGGAILNLLFLGF